jgi:hypothetical protein
MTSAAPYAAGIFSSLQPQNVRLRRAINIWRPRQRVRSIQSCSIRAGGLPANLPNETRANQVRCLARGGIGIGRKRVLRNAAIRLDLEEGRSASELGGNAPAKVRDGARPQARVFRCQSAFMLLDGEDGSMRGTNADERDAAKCIPEAGIDDP